MRARARARVRALSRTVLDDRGVGANEAWLAIFSGAFRIRSPVRPLLPCDSICTRDGCWGSGMAERGGAPGRTQGYAGKAHAGTWPPRGAAWAGGIAPSGLAAWPPFAEKLREWIAAEAGAGRLLPWVPVAFGIGIACYFTADHEPVAAVTAVAALALCVAAFLLRRHRLFPLAVMIA